jgi:hypothetical protein
MPVHVDGPVSVRASWTKKPTAAAKETKDTTYEMKSHSFILQFKITRHFNFITIQEVVKDRKK